MQVSLYLAHYWIIPAESYSQHYLELDSSWFAYSASGCHMGASAFIFLALYCLNKDPHCFLFSKPHPQTNKLFHWKKKNTRQGNTTHLPAEKREEGGNATNALRHAEIRNRPNAQSCSPSHCVWCSYIFLIMLSKTHTNPVWPSLTVLDLISSSVEPSRDVGSAEFQLLASIHFDNTLITNGEVEQVKMNNGHNF